MSLIRKNFIYNNLLGFTNIITPLIIFPYISRILGPEGVGIPAFAISLTATFVILGSLGIPIYGIREIAKVKEDPLKLSKTFSEIFVIQLIWMCITLCIYFFWIVLTDTFKDEEIIKYASFLHIVSLIGMFNWFYQGIENYAFITKINVLVKLLTIVLVYVLINSPDDYWIYYCILVGVTIVGSFCSIINIFKYTTLKLSSLNFKKHLKPIGVLFSTQLAIGIYINLDILFLKYFSNEAEVGLYAAANKVVKTSLLVVTSLGTVLIPKIALLIQENKIEEIKNTIQKSIQFVLMMVFPILILLWLLSPEIIQIFAGDQFLFSATLMQYLMPLLLFVGMSNIFGLQILVPFNKEKKLMIAVIIGAVISVFLNVLFIPKWNSLGAVYAILITEFIITGITFYYAKKTIKFNFPIKSGKNYILICLLFFPIYYGLQLICNGVLLFLTAGSICLATYILTLYLIKDGFFMNVILKPILKNK